MEEILLLTIERVVQAGDDVLVSPPLPAVPYEYDSNGTQRVKIVTPDQRVIEKDAEFSIPLGTRSRSYILLFPNTKEAEIPVGSQVWVRRNSSQPPPEEMI
ncbi:MAG TPA: hypothetical protein VK897_13865 [Anaerolineales bacterium]|nr:hypothetical protein [Anaerolineales bacterium]